MLACISPAGVPTGGYACARLRFACTRGCTRNVFTQHAHTYTCSIDLETLSFCSRRENLPQVPGMIYQVFMNGTRLGCYPTAKRLLRDDGSESMANVARGVCAGAVTGGMGAVVGSPFFMVKCRLQGCEAAGVCAAAPGVLFAEKDVGALHGPPMLSPCADEPKPIFSPPTRGYQRSRPPAASTASSTITRA